MPNEEHHDDDAIPEEAQVKFPNHSQKIISAWVLAVGAFGGLFVKFVPIKGIDVAELATWKSVLAGSVAAFLSIFYVAKTDLRRFWNVICVALLCGISGPTVLEAIVKPTAASNSKAAATTAREESEKLPDTSAATEPAKFQKAVDDTTQSATASLQLYKKASAAGAEEKKGELAKTETALKETLQNLDSVKEQSPTTVLSAVAQIAAAAKESGADSVATRAQQIITSAQNSDKSGVKEAANAPPASYGPTDIFFITPEPLTDSRLQELRSQITANFAGVAIQSAVHPKTDMNAEKGIEVVYYNPVQSSLAGNLLEFVKHYSGATQGKSRPGFTRDGSQPSQVDVHVNRDVADKWPMGTPPPTVPGATVTPTPSAAPSPEASAKPRRGRR